MEFQVGQYIENKSGQIGQIKALYKFCLSVRVGEYASDMWNKDDVIAPSSKDAFLAQLAGDEAALQAAKAAIRSKEQKVYRWQCLSCGHRHNSKSCPQCGSDDKVYNNGPDADASIFAGGVGRAEPYTPGE